MRPTASRSAAFSSLIPRSIVLRATPVAAATAVTPPRPSDSASLAANNRRARSSNSGLILKNRAERLPTSITLTKYRHNLDNHTDIVILLLRCSAIPIR